VMCACVIQMYIRGTGTGETQEIKYMQFRDLSDIHCIRYVTWKQGHQELEPCDFPSLGWSVRVVNRGLRVH
jgi:hypothetical protein